MHVDGTCHCGFITYEAEVDPASVSLCHCTDCQIFTSSAFRIVAVTRADDLKLLSGAPSFYVKTADSGNRRVQAFCPRCGTHVYSSADVANPALYGLRVGSIRQRTLLPPVKQIWCGSALEWVHRLDTIPASEAVTLTGQAARKL